MTQHNPSRLTIKLGLRDSTSAESKTRMSAHNETRITKNDTDSTIIESVKGDNSIAKSRSTKNSHYQADSKSDPMESKNENLIESIEFTLKDLENLPHPNVSAGNIFQRNFYTFGVDMPLYLMKAGLRLLTMVVSDQASFKELSQGADSTLKQKIKPKPTLNLVIKSELSASELFSGGEITKVHENTVRLMQLSEICAEIIKLGSYIGDGEQIHQIVTKTIRDDIIDRGGNSKFEEVAIGWIQIRSSFNNRTKTKHPIKSASLRHRNELSLIDAILSVLLKADNTIHYREISQRIIKAKLFKFQAINPSNSVIACIDRYIKASGDQSLIERVTPGRFKFRGCQSTNLKSNNQSNHPNQNKKLTLIEATVKVLESANQPLSVVEITNRIIKFGLFSFNTLAPKKSVVAKICSHIESKGKKSEIVRVSKGIYILRNSKNTKQTKKNKKSKNGKNRNMKISEIVIKVY